MRNKNIVIIGGGTGTFTLLSGLRKFPVEISVIVSSSDDGGSTGRLREDYGVFPPGDLRQCLLGLSHTGKNLKDFFAYRFEEGELKGHVLGNIVLAALEKTQGGIERAIILAAKMLNVRGEVVPMTLYPTKLLATLENGKKITGEHNIDETDGKYRSPIVSLKLSPSKAANKRAILCIRRANVIVLGPGDLFTSILPNLLVKGIAEAVALSKAKKVLTVNLMTKRGQTDGFKATDFVKVLNGYLGKNTLDTVIVNSKKPDPGHLKRYKKEGALFIEPQIPELKRFGLDVIAKNLLSKNVFGKSNSDVLARSFLRHDSDKLAEIISRL